jgi:hypothetical protein
MRDSGAVASMLAVPTVTIEKDEMRPNTVR